MTEHGPFIWTQLHLPAPLTPESARDALQALAGLSGQPRLVLEARGRVGRVAWRLGCDRDITPRAIAALQIYLSGLRTERWLASSPEPLAAGQLRAPGHRSAPLDVSRTEAVTRGVLAALAQARADESVQLQLILGVRRAPRVIRPSEQTDTAARRRAASKYHEPRFGCTLRLAATAATPERTRNLVLSVLGALRGLQAPGVTVALSRVSVQAVQMASSPFLWPLELGLSEIVAVLGWPVATKPDTSLPGVASSHPAALPSSPAVARRGRVVGHSTVDAQQPVALSIADSLKHLHLLGPTGVGKSTLMAQLALQDIAAGRGVVVIDPKGDLVETLLARIPGHRHDDVVVLDPTDAAPVGLDVFAGEPDLAADTMLSVLHSLYADSWGPRTQDILHAALLTLARRGDASVAMVPLLLTNAGFRRSITGRVTKADPLGLGSFWSWFEAISDAERTQAIAPLMNKLRPLLLRPGLRAVFGQRRPKFKLTDVFHQRKILLVSLGAGALGPEGAQLLGSITVALLWQAAQSRIRVPDAQRAPVLVHIDEVQEYLRLPGDLGAALAQARGLGVGFTLAHQHLGQLPNRLREAMLANVRSRVYFQLSAKDAREIATTSQGVLDARDLQQLPAFQAYASLLNTNTATPWCSLRTHPLEAPDQTGVADAVRARSRQSYGRHLDEIEQDLLQLSGVDARSGAEPLGRHRPEARS